MIARVMTFVIVLLVALMPVSVFGQTAEQNYKEALSAEFRSDHATNRDERSAYSGEAFGKIVEAFTADGRYADAFGRIARKRLAMSGSSLTEMTDGIVRLGQKRGTSPVVRAVASEVAKVHIVALSKSGFGPEKPLTLKKARLSGTCVVPYKAEQIVNLSKIAGLNYQAVAWARYGAGFYMIPLRHCGGEGNEADAEPAMALPLYIIAGDKAGMHKSAKMVGDRLVENFLFGGYDDTPNGESRGPGFRGFYDRAMVAYRQGGVTRNEIRETLLKFLRRAEAERLETSTKLAQQMLNGTF